MGIAADIIVIVLAAALLGMVAHFLRQPLVVAYILAGIVLGPLTDNALVYDLHGVELLAEIGVGLLLFGLGLEFSFSRLKPVRNVSVFGAPIQMALSMALGYAVGWSIGWGQVASLWLGALVSLSSTMVLLKTLMNQGRIGTLSSQVMIGMLIIQDLAVVPLMILMPKLSDPAAGLMPIVFAAVKGAGFLAVMIVLGMRVLPRLLAWAAGWQSRELFLLIVTAIGLGLGYATYLLGLSFAFGGFVAGMVLSESDYGHQALADIISVRDLFGLLFFTSVGMLLDIRLLFEYWREVLALVTLLSVGKMLIFAAVTRAFGYRRVVPLATALGLFQIGEFSFVIAKVGQSAGALTMNQYSLVLSVAVVTMVLTPFVSSHTEKIYGFFKRRAKAEPIQALNLPTGELADHVLIAGFGKVGSHIAGLLSVIKIPFILVELDGNRLAHARQLGYPVIYGDATQHVVLEAAGVRRARLLLITAPAAATARHISAIAQQYNPGLKAVARAESMEQLNSLRTDGVEVVVQPELEAGLQMTRQALLLLGVPLELTHKYTEEMRRDQYAPLCDEGVCFNKLDLFRDALHLLELTWARIEPGSPLNGKTLGELALRSATGSTVVGVYREGKLHRIPGAAFTLHAGDEVAVIGEPMERKAFEALCEPAGAAIPAI